MYRSYIRQIDGYFSNSNEIDPLYRLYTKQNDENYVLIQYPENEYYEYIQQAQKYELHYSFDFFSDDTLGLMSDRDEVHSLPVRNILIENGKVCGVKFMSDLLTEKDSIWSVKVHSFPGDRPHYSGFITVRFRRKK